MTTIYHHDRFKTETDFGTKLCYTLGQVLQVFFDHATHWSNMATNGEPDYLQRQAENLIKRIEDGRAQNIMLPAVLLSSPPATAGAISKRQEIDPQPTKPSPTDD
jgi:hypothetical protein